MDAKCTKCNNMKPFEEFVNKRRENHRFLYCAECREKNKSYVREFKKHRMDYDMILLKLDALTKLVEKLMITKQ